MSEAYEKMTVLALRRVAKEMGVKLGAGISKQGIIEKLTAAGASASQAKEAPVQEALEIPETQETQEAPEAPGAPAHPVRKAAIIADDEPEEETDDIPVLTPNQILRDISRPAPSAPVPRPAAPRPAPAQSGASSLSNISSKAPAFTMEGSRAWHNPRAFQAPAPGYQRAPASWGARPAQPGPADSRPYAPRAPQARPDSRLDMRQAPRPAAQYPQRFGPEQTEEPRRPADYRAPYAQPADVAPAPRQDYAPAYAPPQAQPAYSPAAQDALMTGECGDGKGVLEVLPDGFGFLRQNYLPGKNDIYVSNAQVRRFGLRTGDLVEGKTRPQRENDRYGALLYITEVNGQTPEEAPQRASFDALTPLYAKRRMEVSAKNPDPTLRLMDLLAPLGYGQRALIALPPQAEGNALLLKLAAAVSPKAQVMTLLLDERPEDVAAVKEAIRGEVVAAAYDEPPENQARCSELLLERALRLAEQKKDVVLLVNSLTALVKANNLLALQAARLTMGGLAAGAMTKARRLFGAARNLKEGGSLTVIALAQTGAPGSLEETMLEDFRRAATMTWQAAGTGAEPDRLLPQKCASRHDELLLSPEELAAAGKLRALLENQPEKALSLLKETKNNAELTARLNAPAED